MTGTDWDTGRWIWCDCPGFVTSGEKRGEQVTLEAVQPLRDLIVCRRYTRPDVSPGGIVLPAPWEQPTDCDLWEVIRGEYKGADVAVGKDVDDFLGTRVVADDILLTLPFRGTFSEVLTRRFAEDIFFVAASDVRAVRRWRDDSSQNEDT